MVIFAGICPGNMYNFLVYRKSFLYAVCHSTVFRQLTETVLAWCWKTQFLITTCQPSIRGNTQAFILKAAGNRSVE